MIPPERLLPIAFLSLCLVAVGLGTTGCGDDSPPVRRETSTGDWPPPQDSPRDTSTIILAADVWPPYNCAPEDTNEGYIIDVAREIFEPLGYRVEYRIVPWKRALAGTQQGLYDGAVAASRVEGPGLVFPEREMVRNRVSFFVRNGDPWRFAGEASLKDVRLGVAHGYDYVGWLNDYIARNADDPDLVQVITGDDPLVQNLKKLVNGHIDVMAGNEGTINYGAAQMGMGDGIHLAGTDSVDSYCYIGFSPSTGNGSYLAGLFDEGLDRMRAAGRFAEILQGYALEDWAPRNGKGR